MVGKRAPATRLGCLLIAAGLAFAACSSDGETADSTTNAPGAITSTTTTTTTTTTSPPTTTSTTTTTTTSAPTTTIDALARPDVLVSNFDRESVDDFDTTGDNLWLVMMEIADLFNFLEGNPTSSGEEMLGSLYLPTHTSWDGLLIGFAEIADNNWRYVDPGTRTVAIEVEAVEDDTAVVQWASERGDQQVADVNGTVVKVYRGWDLDLLTYRLQRGDDRRWRIAETLERVSPIPQDVLEGMVPVQWSGRRP